MKILLIQKLKLKSQTTRVLNKKFEKKPHQFPLEKVGKVQKGIS
jgi:hypothetical protein